MANPSKVLCPVMKVEPHGEGVYQVTFEIPSRYTRFRAGQFLHLALDEFDPTTGFWPESRVFSIASEPRQEAVSIVYSVKGEFTKRMERELTPGREVWLKLPYGSFVIDEGLGASGSLVLIGGGTGVSPYVPFLAADRTDDGVVHLFYGVRKAQQLLFFDLWQSCQTKPWIRLHLRIEEGSLDGLPFERGKLSIDSVAERVGQTFHNSHFFLSGPPGMIQSFRIELRTRGIPDSQIHIDEWE